MSWSVIKLLLIMTVFSHMIYDRYFTFPATQSLSLSLSLSLFVCV